jgi:hypothetical protein
LSTRHGIARVGSFAHTSHTLVVDRVFVAVVANNTVVFWWGLETRTVCTRKILLTLTSGARNVELDTEVDTSTGATITCVVVCRVVAIVAGGTRRSLVHNTTSMRAYIRFEALVQVWRRTGHFFT